MGNPLSPQAFLLHHAKKSAVNQKVEGSFPNLGERLVHHSIQGSVVGHAINATCGCICGTRSRKNETKKDPYPNCFCLPVQHLEICSLMFLKNPALQLKILGSKH
jgi:hypothetical protein